MAWKLRYIDGVKTPPTPALFLGTRVHDALEMFYRHRQLGVGLSAETAVKRIADSWEAAVDAESMTFESVAAELQLKQQAADLVRVYLTLMADAHDIPLAVETTLQRPLIDPTTGEDQGIPLLGVLDLILDDRDGRLICDFKTSGKSAAPFEVTHEIQLSCYAYLYRQATGREEGGLEIRSLIKTKAPKIEFHSQPVAASTSTRCLSSNGPVVDLWAGLAGRREQIAVCYLGGRGLCALGTSRFLLG